MSGLKDLIIEEPVHQRKLEIKTFPASENRMVVEGCLKDDRLVTGYHWNGTERKPGIIHHMFIRLLIGGFPITILDAEAEMPGVPQEACIELKNSVKKIIGVKIVSGYSDEIRKRVGGINGCTHLTHLLVVMGPAALHGFWNHAAMTPRPIPKSFDAVPGLNYLVNSCKLWAEDGPFIEKIKEEIEKAHSE